MCDDTTSSRYTLLEYYNERVLSEIKAYILLEQAMMVRRIRKISKYMINFHILISSKIIDF